MSDYIKYMYREYLEGRTRIKKVNEDQPLFPNTGAGLLIQKNKLTDDWTALNVSDGHYEEESFNHEALAAAFLQGANMGQLCMLNEILDRARLNGPYCLENVADALLSFAPACKAESLMENPMLHFIELSKSFSKNGGIYDPVHGIYIDSKVNGLGDVPHFTLYDVSVADIEECMAWGTKHLDEVPGQIHVVNGSPHIATIYVTGPDDRRINDLLFTLCEPEYEILPLGPTSSEDLADFTEWFMDDFKSGVDFGCDGNREHLAMIAHTGLYREGEYVDQLLTFHQLDFSNAHAVTEKFSFEGRPESNEFIGDLDQLFHDPNSLVSSSDIIDIIEVGGVSNGGKPCREHTRLSDKAEAAKSACSKIAESEQREPGIEKPTHIEAK